MSFVLHLISKAHCKVTMLWFWQIQVKFLEQVCDITVYGAGSFKSQLHKWVLQQLCELRSQWLVLVFMERNYFRICSGWVNIELWKGRKLNAFVILVKSKNGNVWKVDGYANEEFEKACRKVAISEIKEDKFSSYV